MTHCHCYSVEAEQLPEVSEYWLALAIQYRRCKKTEAAATAVLNAYLGNWAFGVPDNKVIHLLSQAADVPNFQDDPVIQCIKEQGLLALEEQRKIIITP